MSDQFSNRRYFIRGFLILGALVLIGKAMQIQLIDDTYAKRGTEAGINKLTYYPSRGLIYDRNGELLINNIPVYDLMVTYNQIDPKMDTTRFCELLGISRKEFKSKIEKDWRNDRFDQRVPYVFTSKIAADTFAMFQEHLYEFPGFFPQIRNIRSYPYANAAHLLGYIREANEREVKTKEYRPGDYVGGSGLEKQYEPYLRGRKGARFMWKDKFGREIGTYKEGERDTIPVSGTDLITTIDIELQAYAEHLMQNKTGSIVAIEPATGEILAMVTTPTYDPNQLIISSNRGEIYNQLLKNPNLPFFDRAVMAEYPPGSIYKTIVGLAALQEGLININSGFSCSQGYYYNNRLYGCHDHVYPGNYVRGIQHSCNSYFWQTFRKLIDKVDFYRPQDGLDDFNNYVYQFGLGRPLGIDFPNEKKGNVPTPEYYNKVYKGGGGWKSPTIMSLGIGQGEIQMTSLQMANLSAILANRGFYFTPHLVKGFKNSSEQIDPKFRERHMVSIDREYFDITAEGLEKVVTAGTASSAFSYGLGLCGKTGTAQNPHGEDHSVFTGFAPKENPKIAIAVFVENAGWGGTYAAPIASLITERYLYPDKELGPYRKLLETNMINANTLLHKEPFVQLEKETVEGEQVQ